VLDKSGLKDILGRVEVGRADKEFETPWCRKPLHMGNLNSLLVKAE
jgi:hypothetical protein